jgi:acetoin utilization deacetylase AcuC-like enzyme
MKAFYTDIFVLPLPPQHRFPMSKYERLRAAICQENIIAPENLLIPPATDNEQLALAHDFDYILAVQEGRLTEREQRKIGFPWTPGMVERSRRSSGATLAAGRAALQDGIAVNLAGGTHHAFYDSGGGYCVFNDAVVTIRNLQREGLIQRGLVVDCDVHQGDGTAAIAQGDPSLFTFSIHGEKNYPFRKQTSDLDLGLPDGTGDADYLAALREGLAHSLQVARPDFVVYLAGADPFIGDRLGRLALSKAGLLARDRLVLEACLSRGLPVAIAMAGGYAKDVADTVEIHLNTVRLAATLQADLKKE